MCTPPEKKKEKTVLHETNFWQKLFTFFILENVKQTLEKEFSYCPSFCSGINSLLLHSLCLHTADLICFLPLGMLKREILSFVLMLVSLEYKGYGSECSEQLSGLVSSCIETSLLSSSPVGTQIAVSVES